ncbi:MAG: hypothetical protein KDH20_18215 [Rhodocyclaceae bacterium]|nr:hypothetical protein [Rhodocyclaceae bacterium]
MTPMLSVPSLWHAGTPRPKCPYGFEHDLSRAQDPLCGLRFEVRTGHLAAAQSLANRRYQQRGLRVGVGGTGERLPGVTVLARKGADLWATLRLGLDSIAGLQADAHYRHEIDRLRGASRRLAEVTRLAIDAPCPPATMLLALFQQAIGHLSQQPPITDLVIEVNPRHARFYIQRFGFSQIGEQRICSRVGAPAVLLHRPVEAPESAAPLAA